MANGGNRTIAPVRKLIAAVLGAVATFVALFGLGMTSWAIVALGVALLVLSIALATVRGGGRTWVVGDGHVHSVTEPPTQYTFGRCQLQLLIDVPGVPPGSRKIIEPRVPVAKWPSLGQILPIRVALDDPRHLRILWDEVPTHAESAATTADFADYAVTEPPDEVLIPQEVPPWAGRTPEDDLADPLGEPVDDDPGGHPEDRGHVRMHHRPGGPVVLEGTVVGQSTDSTLPRRATPAPRTPAEEQFDAPPAPLDPLDLPLDDPLPPQDRVRDEGIVPDHPDEAIFGFDPDATVDPEAPINGVGLTLLVTELDRSLEFYRDMLGFAEVDRGSGNAVLASGETRLVLREVTDAAPINRRLVHVNLDVDDIQAAYERLRDSGVRFTYAPRVVNRGARLEVWAAAFRDPDGHGIALTQWRQRAEA